MTLVKLDSMKGICGIYRLTNAVTGKIYVGSSVDIRGRMYKHFFQLRAGKHNNAHLQAAYSRDGEDAFVLDLLEECSREDILSREQHYIDALKPEFNICPVAGNTLGYRHDDASRQKMTLANMGNQRWLGKKHTDETREKLSAFRTGRKLSPEHVAKIKEANRGNQHTAGHTLSDAHRAKVSAGLGKAWANGGRSKEAAADRVKAKWADPVWKAAQLERIAAGRAAKRQGRGLE